MNWFRIAWRSQAPAVAVVAVAIGLSIVFGRIAELGTTPDRTAVLIATYLPLAALGGAALWWLAVWFRLKAWESGRAEPCDHCSGPLGLMRRPGKHWYGKQLPDFHRCWNCGRATGVD